jgi:peptidoglycan DL-endopeptidase LytE
MGKTIITAILILMATFALPSLGSAAQIKHTVKQGDNLYGIAKKYHISSDKLKKQNNLKSTKLAPGQILVIEEDKIKTTINKPREKNGKKQELIIQETRETAPETDGEFIEYKTKKGDTIDKIATLFNVAKDDLIESNNFSKMKSKRLPPGKIVLVPKVIDEGEEEVVALQGPNKSLRTWKDGEEKYMLVKVAKSFMGAPYKYGGNTVKGLDCSAYVKKIYEIFDVELPRSARQQFSAGQQVAKNDLAIGDLVFFRTIRYVKYPTHVGIYIGEGNFIHSSSGHGRIGVKIDCLSSDYYSKAYTGAVRVKSNTSDMESQETTSKSEKKPNNS